MAIVNIYWSDLTQEKQQELWPLLECSNGNYDIFPITSLELPVLIERNGKRMLVPFCEIQGGDFIVDHSFYAGCDAHVSGDASYDGWLFYDEDGNSWFPEDM